MAVITVFAMSPHRQDRCGLCCLAFSFGTFLSSSVLCSRNYEVSKSVTQTLRLAEENL